jgi:putative hydrolase of the HAD superfamily
MSAPVWLFDLDNTLHHASVAIFPHLNRQMTQYLMRHLGLSESEANALRVRYWRAYGATLVGLMRRHRVNPRHFLAETHRFDDLARHVHAPARLAAILSKLPGRKAVFTNGPRAYARSVLTILGVAHLFDRLFGIEDLAYHPKPRLRAYQRILKALSVPPSQIIFVEDSPENLVPAKRLGMTTVWITRARGFPTYVDHKITRLDDLARVLAASHGRYNQTN